MCYKHNNILHACTEYLRIIKKPPTFQKITSHRVSKTFNLELLLSIDVIL